MSMPDRLDEFEEWINQLPKSENSYTKRGLAIAAWNAAKEEIEQAREETRQQCADAYLKQTKIGVVVTEKLASSIEFSMRNLGVDDDK